MKTLTKYNSFYTNIKNTKNIFIINLKNQNYLLHHIVGTYLLLVIEVLVLETADSDIIDNELLLE